MDKEKIIQAAIKTLEKDLAQLEEAIRGEEQKRKEAPSAMQSWSDNTRFEKEILVSQLGGDRENLKRHLKFLRSLSKETKTKVEPGALIEVENLVTKQKNFYFISLSAGLEIELEKRTIFFLSNNSPLVGFLSGKEKGGRVVFNLGGKKQELKVLNLE